MKREEAMEWILPALRGADAPSHLPQLTPGPPSSKKSVGALAAEKNACMAAEMERHAPANPNAVKLSDEQQYVVDLVKQGNNVFFTGSAGVPRLLLLLLLLLFLTWHNSTQARASRSACGRSSVFFVKVERKACLSPPVQALQQ